MPAAAVRVAASAPARAVTRGSPNLRAGILRPSASAAGWASRSKAGPDAARGPLFGQPFLTGRLGRRRGLGVLPPGTAPLLALTRAVDVPLFPRVLVRGVLVRGVLVRGVRAAGGTGV